MGPFAILLLGVLLVQATTSTDLITLQKGRENICIYPKKTSPIYVSPVVEEIDEQPSSLLNGIWFNDDWDDEGVKSFFHGVITDKRWEGYKIITTRHLPFQGENNKSFSVYAESEANLKIHMKENGKPAFCNLGTQKGSDEWVHYTVSSTENKVYCLRGSYVVQEIGDFNPDEIVITSNKEVYIKIHENFSKVSKTATKEVGSTLKIPPTGKSCLVFYIHLCPKCTLETTINSNENSTRKNSFSSTESWQEHVIDIEPDKETNITFIRRHTENEEHGFWEIDFRECPDVVGNMGIYKTVAAGNASIKRNCKILNDVAAEDLSTNFTICSELGRLGSNCTMTCESISGPEAKNCEEYRICNRYSCSCAWGYHGQACNKRCNSGGWGMNCQHFCQSSCVTCDAKTGDCLDSFRTLIILMMIMVVVSGVIAMLLYRRTMRDQADDSLTHPILIA